MKEMYYCGARIGKAGKEDTRMDGHCNFSWRIFRSRSRIWKEPHISHVRNGHESQERQDRRQDGVKHLLNFSWGRRDGG